MSKARFARNGNGSALSGHTVALHGAKELDAILKALPKRIANKIQRTALRAGAKLIQAEAKKLAPKDTGLLRRSITVRNSKRRKKGRHSVVIFPDIAKFQAKVDLGSGGDNKIRQASGDFYAPFVEYGTDKTEAQPFMRPAYDRKVSEALSVIRKEIERGIAESTRMAG